MLESITKINRILKGLMSCQLEFHPIETLERSDWNAHDLSLMSRSTDDRPQFIESESSRSFGFPVNIHGRFAGLAVVRDMKAAKHSQLIQLAELLTVVLECSLERESKSENLRLIQERLQVLGEETNVVPMRSLRLSRAALQVEDLPEKPVSIDHAISSQPLLIEVPEGFPLRRVALEVHQMSARWAFLALEHLAPGILGSREELKALGGITLYIEDLSKLSATEQEQLANYLATKPGEDMPQVIAGVFAPIESLRSHGALLPRLIDSFCVTRLNWTYRNGQQVTKDLVEASLRFIIERAREQALVPGDEGLRFLPMNVFQLRNDSPTLH
jgi:Sigma-54 interaction domain